MNVSEFIATGPAGILSHLLIEDENLPLHQHFTNIYLPLEFCWWLFDDWIEFHNGCCPLLLQG